MRVHGTEPCLPPDNCPLLYGCAAAVGRRDAHGGLIRPLARLRAIVVQGWRRWAESQPPPCSTEEERAAYARLVDFFAMEEEGVARAIAPGPTESTVQVRVTREEGEVVCESSINTKMIEQIKVSAGWCSWVC